LGLDITPCQIRFIIWFKKEKTKSYIPALKRRFGAQYEESDNGLWIILDYKDFTDFCDTAKACQSRSGIIRQFLASVLEILA
jgi:hypothetical protein